MCFPEYFVSSRRLPEFHIVNCRLLLLQNVIYFPFIGQETAGDAKNTQETPANVPIVYQILNQNGLGGENNIIFVTTYPPKDQTIPPKDPPTAPSSDNIIRILDEKHPEEMLTMQSIPENPTNGIFSTSSIALQLDSTEDYRFLLTDK